jgi:hypothetical protein
MVFHIEGNSKWAYKFNSQMVKCHEMIESNLRSNDVNEEEIEDEDFIKEFIKVAEGVERVFDFAKEIKAKKENEKLKMIMEI